MSPSAPLRRPDGRDWARVLLVCLVLTLVVVVGVGAAVSLAAFNPYNPTWEGTSDVRTMLEEDPDTDLTIVRSAERYDELGPGDTALVLAPTAAYDEEAAGAVRDFVERGGTLVVLDNFGPNGNTLLEDVGADVRFDGQLLRDEQFHDRAPTMPVATGITPHPLTVDVESLTLNYATALDVEDDAVVVRTSNVAYLGAADDEIGDDDELAAYPIVAVEEVGNGAVIAVGDPSVTVNEMLHRNDNRAFVANLANTGDRVAIDVSHASTVPPLRVGVLVVRSEPVIAAGVGLAGVLAVVITGRRVSGRPTRERLARRLPRWAGGAPPKRAPVDEGVRREALRARHPDWDDERLDRLLEVLNPATDEPSRRDD